jgi:hypothetical protein
MSETYSKFLLESVLATVEADWPILALIERRVRMIVEVFMLFLVLGLDSVLCFVSFHFRSCVRYDLSLRM